MPTQDVGFTSDSSDGAAHRSAPPKWGRPNPDVFDSPSECSLQPPPPTSALLTVQPSSGHPGGSSSQQQASMPPRGPAASSTPASSQPPPQQQQQQRMDQHPRPFPVGQPPSSITSAQSVTPASALLATQHQSTLGASGGQFVRVGGSSSDVPGGAAGPGAVSADLVDQSSDGDCRDAQLAMGTAEVAALLAKKDGFLRRQSRELRRLADENRRMQDAVVRAEARTAELEKIVETERGRGSEADTRINTAEHQVETALRRLHGAEHAIRDRDDEIKDLRDKVADAHQTLQQSDAARAAALNHERQRAELCGDRIRAQDDVIHRLESELRDARKSRQEVKRMHQEQLDETEDTARELAQLKREFSQFQERVRSGALVDVKNLYALENEVAELRQTAQMVHGNNRRLVALLSKSTEFSPLIQQDHVGESFVFCGSAAACQSVVTAAGGAKRVQAVKDAVVGVAAVDKNKHFRRLAGPPGVGSTIFDEPAAAGSGNGGGEPWRGQCLSHALFNEPGTAGGGFKVGPTRRGLGPASSGAAAADRAVAAGGAATSNRAASPTTTLSRSVGGTGGAGGVGGGGILGRGVAAPVVGPPGSEKLWWIPKAAYDIAAKVRAEKLPLIAMQDFYPLFVALNKVWHERLECKAKAHQQLAQRRAAATAATNGGRARSASRPNPNSQNGARSLPVSSVAGKVELEALRREVKSTAARDGMTATVRQLFAAYDSAALDAIDRRESAETFAADAQREVRRKERDSTALDELASSAVHFHERVLDVAVDGRDQTVEFSQAIREIEGELAKVGLGECSRVLQEYCGAMAQEYSTLDHHCHRMQRRMKEISAAAAAGAIADNDENPNPPSSTSGADAGYFGQTERASGAAANRRSSDSDVDGARGAYGRGRTTAAASAPAFRHSEGGAVY